MSVVVIKPFGNHPENFIQRNAHPNVFSQSIKTHLHSAMSQANQETQSSNANQALHRIWITPKHLSHVSFNLKIRILPVSVTHGALENMLANGCYAMSLPDSKPTASKHRR